MNTWPATLPSRPLLEGATESWPDVVIRSNTDTGPAKLRQRYTAGVTRFYAQFVLNSTQVGTFETFFKTTISNGATAFTMANPRTGTSVTMRFVGVPQITPIAGGYSRVGCTIEAMP